MRMNWKVGRSFTITPCVLKRKELGGGGKIIGKREVKSPFRSCLRSLQVRVTDQNGQEVEPAEDG